MKRNIAVILLTLCISISAVSQVKELKPGDKAPLFETTDQHGKRISLAEMLTRGKVVVMFYRGYWCPYCNRQLKAYQDSLTILQSKGTRIVAITPEKPANIQKSIGKSKAAFSILHDADRSMMTAYGVAYTLDANATTRLRNVGVDLYEVNGNNTNTLPVPAVFVVNQQGIIEFIFFDPNYRNRLSVHELIQHL